VLNIPARQHVSRHLMIDQFINEMAPSTKPATASSRSCMVSRRLQPRDFRQPLFLKGQHFQRNFALEDALSASRDLVKKMIREGNSD
jgi:hypothetical protein